MPPPAGKSQDRVATDVYPVQKLLRQRVRNGEHQFLVKWLGFPASHNSWVSADDILNDRLIEQFYNEHPHATRCDDEYDYSPRVAALFPGDSNFQTPVLAAFSYKPLHHRSVPYFPSIQQPSVETFSSTCPTEVHDDCLGIAPLFSSENTIETLVLAACSVENAHEQAPPCFSHESALQPLTHRLPPHVVLPDVSSAPPPPPLIPDSHLHGNLLKVSHYEIPLTTMDLPHVQTPHVSKGSDNTALHATRMRPACDPQPILGPRTGYEPSFRPILWLMVLLVSLLIVPVCTKEYDEMGKKITFFPDSLMIATNSWPLIFFNDSKLVSIHADLQAFLHGANPAINIICDPAQTAFYKKVLASVRGIQCTTHRFYSFQGVTNLLECDRFFTAILPVFYWSPFAAVLSHTTLC